VALALMVLFVIGVIIVVGEVWVRPAVEDRIAEGIVDELGLTATPDVQVRGFPLVLRALQERLDGIDVTAEGQVFEGLRVESVELRIDDVAFTTGEILRGDGTVRISGGDGTAEILDEDLSTYLTSIGLDANVEFISGAVRVSGPISFAGVSTDVSTTGTLGLTGDTLTFVPTDVDLRGLSDVVDTAAATSLVRTHFTFQAPVPDLHGVQLVAVRVGDGVATIDATFDALDVTY
jgi:hypothetical protein